MKEGDDLKIKMQIKLQLLHRKSPLREVWKCVNASYDKTQEVNRTISLFAGGMIL